jgi:predicted phosphohydrolase
VSKLNAAGLLTQGSYAKELTMTVEVIEYVDYGVCGEYGWFGKVVAKSDVIGKDEKAIQHEIKAMLKILGGHVCPIRVERV